MTWPPLGWFEDSRLLTQAEMRPALVQAAMHFLGMGPADLAYRQLCYPHDTDRDAKRMAGAQSACALVCAGLLRCLGFEHGELDLPYAARFSAPPRGVDAMTRLQVMGGWHRDPATLPGPGEIGIMGDGLRTHAFVCVGLEPDVLASVDGGTGRIRLVRRTIVLQGGKVGLRDVSSGTRWMLGVLRVGELVATRPGALPPKP
jgi:hypothetical protein